MKGFDCNCTLTYDKALQFKQNGYDFTIRYVGRLQQASFDITNAEIQNILKAGLQLGLVQHCPKPDWVTTKELGVTYGQNALNFAKEAGYQKGCIVYLDLEGLKSGTPKQDIIDFSNAWYDEVSKEYTAGIYIGYNIYLSGDELYNKLKFKHYWKSLSRVPDIPIRGYEMSQFDGGTVCGIQIDRNEMAGDKLGNSPVFMIGDNIESEDIVMDNCFVGKKIVIATTLNVREKQDTTAKILGQFKQGDIIDVTGQIGSFYRCIYNSKDAFVHGDYVKDYVQVLPDYTTEIKELKVDIDTLTKANTDLKNKITNAVNALK